MRHDNQPHGRFVKLFPKRRYLRQRHHHRIDDSDHVILLWKIVEPALFKVPVVRLGEKLQFPHTISRMILFSPILRNVGVLTYCFSVNLTRRSASHCSSPSIAPAFSSSSVIKSTRLACCHSAYISRYCLRFGVWRKGPEIMNPTCLFVKKGMWLLKKLLSKKSFQREERNRSLSATAATLII